MEPPLKLQFPPEIASNIKISNKCPVHCTHRFDFASTIYVTSDLGELISQSINGDDYWIELLTISILQNSYINLTINRTFFCIAIILQGAIPNQMVGGSLLNLPGSSYNMFCLPAGLHRIDLQKGNYIVLFMVPASHLLKKMGHEHPKLEYLVKLVQAESKYGAMLESFEFPYQVWLLIQEIENCKETGAILDLTLRRYILEILTLYNKQLAIEPQSQSHSNKEKAFKVRDYILVNLENAVLGGLHEVCLLFHITPRTLTREFHMLFQKTVPEYIRDVRLDKAHYLLSHTDLSIQEVSEKTGYPYAAHFSRDFKHKYGISPTSLKHKKDDNHSEGSFFFLLPFLA